MSIIDFLLRRKCDHDFKLIYYKTYIDASLGMEVDSLQYDAYCVKCGKMTLPRFIYGSVPPKDDLVKMLNSGSLPGVEYIQ